MHEKAFTNTPLVAQKYRENLISGTLRGNSWQPLITQQARKECSFQSFSASHIGPRADCPFHRPAYFRPRWMTLRQKFSLFTNHVIKTKIVAIRWTKSRILDKIDDWYINNLAKNQVSAVFHSRVICRSLSPKFIDLCMETPCLCPSEGNKHGGRKVTETSVT